MDFRIKIDTPAQPKLIDHSTNMVTIGSCFSDNIALRMKNAGFTVQSNPFGTIYNPISIYNSLEFILTNKTFKENELFYFNDLWHSYYHHSDFSGVEKLSVISAINNSISASHEFLKNCNLLCITLGSAHIYTKIKQNLVVSNCHKVPQKEFKREMLTVDKIIQIYNHLVSRIQKFNSNILLLFTISPVRYHPKNAQENQLSKATLLLAVNSIVKNNTNCYYFPAYELALDELRDYRFYKHDMVHLNELAIEYIWEKFKESYMTQEVKNIVLEVNKIKKAIEHRPGNIYSEKYKEFCQKQIEKILALLVKYPTVKLHDELNFFQSNLEAGMEQ